MDSPRPYLTIRETAALLALSVRTIHRYIAEGKLRAYRVAGERPIRIKREDVDALLKPLGGEAATAETSDEGRATRNNSGRRA